MERISLEGTGNSNEAASCFGRMMTHHTYVGTFCIDTFDLYLLAATNNHIFQSYLYMANTHWPQIIGIEIFSFM